MPTYRNDSNGTLKATSIGGDKILIPPGSEIQTYNKLEVDNGFWTKTADTPYYNPVLNVNNTIAGASAGDLHTMTLNESTNVVEIYNRSEANLEVMIDSEENTPGYQVPTMTIRILEGVYPHATRLVFKFSAITEAGQVIVTEKDESDGN